MRWVKGRALEETTLARVHIDTLRRSDPVTLDILLADPLRRPMAQLTTATVADMCALSEAPHVTEGQRRALVAFAIRMGREIADLPDGPPFAAFLTELEGLPSSQIPQALRVQVIANLDPRPEAVRARMSALFQRWEGEPADAIEAVSGKPVILKAKAAEPPEDAPSRVRTPRSPSERAAKAPKAPRAAPVKLVDEDRVAWIKSTLMERLEEYVSQGLREDVLVAGIKHRGRANYPDLNPAEIVGVLHQLESKKKVSRSAGRWKLMLGH